MLQRGDRVPHFEVTCLDGSRSAYARIWQRKNLLLVQLPGAPPADATLYSERLARRTPELTGSDTECVMTADRAVDIPGPGVVVADRWGEVYFVAHGAAASDLPDPDELAEWLDYVRHECPECQGEAW